MTRVIDLWRAVDVEARMVSGSVAALERPIRGVGRTRAAPPHLPDLADGQLLMADAAVIPSAGLGAFLAAVREAGLDPAAVWIAGEATDLEAAAEDLAVISGAASGATTGDAAQRYLEDDRAALASVSGELRLAGAEAALADPQPSAPAGLIASRVRRGVAVGVDGALAALIPRPAGRALARRFAAAHARLFAGRAGVSGAARQTRDGLWLLERPVGPAASAWLFDDLPFARLDEVALEALAVTLRALLRRRPAESAGARREPRLPPSTGDPVRDTLMAVARANGRIAPAARSLGVHRNTVLYRLRRASTDLGIDPRRPDDALRLLKEAERD